MEARRSGSIPLRVDQLLSRFGYCSRREAAAWVQAGRVTEAASGEPLRRPDRKVAPDSVRIDGGAVEFPDGLLILLHKPAGYACSHDPAEAPLVYDLLPERWMRRNPGPVSVGRLDRDTSGLLLITDDGALVHRLTSPRHEVEKCYEVETAAPFPPGLPELFASGTLLLRGDGKPCRPARFELTGPQSARVYLKEGKYHQVRRMFSSQGCPVTRLHRSAFGNLQPGDLPAGEWREVTEAEIHRG